MISIAFFVQVCRQRRGGGGVPQKLIFADRGGGGSKKAQNTLTSYLNSPLLCRWVGRWLGGWMEYALF